MRSTGVTEQVMREQLPDYPLSWELLPPSTFARLKRDWERRHREPSGEKRSAGSVGETR